MISREQIPFLKSVNLLKGIPDEMLDEVASILEEIQVGEGQVIFQKGDPGDCMYIVAEGLVQVQDGERLLNYLGREDVFGEMAILDPEPRSASITAVEKTSLYRLDRDSFFRLLNRNSEVSQSVIQILVRRLRERLRDMAEDYVYMQQFSRLTSAALAVEAGIYEPDYLDEVAQRTDELGQLARVFQRMEREVHTREERLRQEVAQLRIVIDESKQARKVAEITDTEYFQVLKQKVDRLRNEYKDDRS